MTNDLVLAIFALDSYNRNFNKQFRVAEHSARRRHRVELDIARRRAAHRLQSHRLRLGRSSSDLLPRHGTHFDNNLLTAALNGFGAVQGSPKARRRMRRSSFFKKWRWRRI